MLRTKLTLSYGKELTSVTPLERARTLCDASVVGDDKVIGVSQFV
jgi:hypothetical protein